VPGVIYGFAPGYLVLEKGEKGTQMPAAVQIFAQNFANTR
jgi:hypothetical protein